MRTTGVKTENSGPGNLISFGMRLSRYCHSNVIQTNYNPCQVLKGEKLKSLATELKAHEKLALTLKKQRHTLDQDMEEEDGSSEMSRLQERNRKQVEDELNLERDLDKILNRYQLKDSGDSDVKYDESHTNHVNSVLPSSKDKDIHARKFDEPRVESLYNQAKDLVSQVEAAAAKQDQSEGKRRLKSMQEWFFAVERDLDVMEGRLRKARFLENELDRYKKKAKPIDKYLEQNQDAFESNHLHPNYGPEGNNLDMDIKDRLKSLRHKVRKTEKEVGDRIIQRKYQEFPTSRTEGDL